MSRFTDARACPRYLMLCAMMLMSFFMIFHFDAAVLLSLIAARDGDVFRYDVTFYFTITLSSLISPLYYAAVFIFADFRR